MKKLIKAILRKMGVQLKRFPDDDIARRMKLIHHFGINKLFDVGANTGQYARQMRQVGYREQIISFEPLKTAFGGLKKTSSKDRNWIINNYALGNEDVKSVINVAGNSASSSILGILPEHLSSAPESKYIGREEIEIKKIDSIFQSFCGEGDNVMLKIDTQGFEKNVIDGAEKSLSRIRIIQLEMSIVPLYENEMLYSDMIDYLARKGFQLYSLENGFSNPETGKLLQVDGVFVNTSVNIP